MSTIEEPHNVGNGGRFVCGCLLFVNSTPSASRAATIFSPCPTRPSTTASPALTDNRRIVGGIGCYDVRPWEDGIADDVLESVAVDSVAMRAAGAV
jgi:hypothetical protein